MTHDTQRPHTQSAWRAVARWIIRLVMLVIVPRDRTPAAAQAWLMLVFGSPWIGLLLYVLIGSPKLTRTRHQIQHDINQILAQTIHQAADLPQFDTLLMQDLSPAGQQIANLAQRLGGMAAFTGNNATLLPEYAQSIQAIIADIDAATNHVHLLYYLFELDPTGCAVRDALLRATQRGVTCRVLVDAIGSRKDVRALVHSLRGAGIAVAIMLPVRLFARERTRPDLRNHRKVVVIDNRIGYTGSQNIGDPTSACRITNQELVVRVTGPVVVQLQAVFLGDWYVETGQQLARPPYLDAAHLPRATGTAIAQVLPSGPAFDTNNNLLLFTNLLYAAQRRAVITTPYFVPDEALLLAIESAALRGVEIHLIVSEVADQFMVSRAQRSYYGVLMAAGVHIHTMRPPILLHAKHISIDQEMVVIGSSNMDMRSFLLDMEIMLIIYDQKVAQALHSIEDEYMLHSAELNAATWRTRPLGEQFLEDTLRLMSPLL